MTRTFVLANSNSYVAANKGVAIVNIHRDTRSGGDTNDTVMRVVVVTAVGSSGISGECTRFWKQSYEQERGSRYQGNVQEIQSTGCATSHLHGGCTTGSRSDNTTTFGHSLVTRTLCESV